MGHESIVVERVVAIGGSRLERVLECDEVRKAFRDAKWSYCPGLAELITEAVVTGLQAPEYKAKVVTMLDMKGG